MKDLKKQAQRVLLPTLGKIQPVVNVASRVAAFAVRIQKPSVMGAIGLVSTGLDAAINHLTQHGGPSGSLQAFASKGQIVEACERAGASLRTHSAGGQDKCVVGRISTTSFTIYPSGVIYVSGDERREFVEWLRQALSHVLPPHIEVRQHKDGDSTTSEAHAIDLTRHRNDQADRILKATLPLLDGGRCILLDGKPGVGKTTLAQIIARESGLGRTVMLPSSFVGASYGESFVGGGNGSHMRDGLYMLNAGVIIVDDIDKVALSLDRLEALRAAAKLVILTANNGQYDDVLDGAMIRAGRVDEVFSIEPVAVPRESPYDRLSDEEWEEVKEWPIAYLTEVRKRLLHRPDDLRLDDLRSRLTRKTRSGSNLY